MINQKNVPSPVTASQLPVLLVRVDLWPEFDLKGLIDNLVDEIAPNGHWHVTLTTLNESVFQTLHEMYPSVNVVLHRDEISGNELHVVEISRSEDHHLGLDIHSPWGDATLPSIMILPLIQKLESAMLLSQTSELSSILLQTQRDAFVKFTTMSDAEPSRQMLAKECADLKQDNERLTKINTALHYVKESFSLPLIVVNQNLEIIQYNRSCAEVLFNADILLGQSISTLYWHFDITSVLDKIKYVVHSGERYCLTLETIEHYVYSLNIMPYRLNKSEISGAILVFEDITERQIAEQALQKSEAHFRQVTSSLPQLMLEMTDSGYCHFVSKQWSDFTGQPDSSLLRQEWMAAIHSDEQNMLIELWEIHKKQHSDFSFQCRVKEANGEFRWFSVRFALLLDDQHGNNWFCSFSDIEGIKQAQLSLQQSEAHVSNIIDTMPEAVLVVNDKGFIDIANKRTEEVFGYAREEIVHQPIEMLLPQRYRHNHVALRDNYVKKPTIRMMGVGRDLFALNKSGEEFPVEVALAPLEEKGKRYSVVSIADITHRKEADTELVLAANVFSNTMDGIVILNAECDIIKVNSAFEHILGYRNEDLIGVNITFLRGEKHHAEFYDDLWGIAKNTGRWQGEIWQRHKRGTETPLWLSLTTIYDHHGEVERYIATIYDISEQKQAQERIHYLAHYDVLSNLPNRTLFIETFRKMLVNSRNKKSKLALLFIDLDNFKQVNDTYGHPAGDSLLCQVSERMLDVTHDDDLVSRYGGDEFLVLLNNIDSRESVEKTATKLMQALTAPIDVGFGDFFVTASIGIACYPEDGSDADNLLQHADLAMYRSKEEGRNQYHFYDNEMLNVIQEHTQLQSELRLAIEKNQLELFYQPIIELATKRCIGVEALVRWHHPKRGDISPMKFIPVAEETTLIHSIGKWVLEKACKQTAQWDKAGIKLRFTSINVSGKQIMQSDFAAIAKEIFDSTQCPAEHVIIELTESFIMHKNQSAIDKLQQLRQLGVGIAIDDFGTGYSSLSYLKRLPVTKLKLDRSFVMDLPSDINDVEITRAIHRLGDAVGLAVIAEGIETEEQHQFLLNEGVTYGQGYLYAKPMSINDFNRFLEQNNIVKQ
ncbi:EAL domain-containing protein [Vibrio sp. CAIM 722]|uniref:cyclic-guanylate-specific phosphodiesterase n=1 Tax=Vibrio eleionomae TaxID=2653505 RepID=A0A7X4LNN5_9VIBR|nr:EAL domain-containing protein [Vibrio eleionomae]MZI95340.1 EAL domain-containing protein [Vibrio eleionomae]